MTRQSGGNNNPLLDSQGFIEIPPADERRYNCFFWKGTLFFYVLVFLVAGVGTVVTSAINLSVGSILGVLAVGCVLIAANRHDGKWVTRPSSLQWLCLVLAVGVGLRLVCVLGLPYKPGRDFIVYNLAGKAMAETWKLSVGAGGLENLRCFFPPLQIFNLGVMHSLFDNGWKAAQLLNVFWSALTILGVWYIGRGLFGMRTGRIAGLLVAMLPSNILGCMLIGAEVPQTFWFVLAMCVYVWLVRHGFKWPAAVLVGICLGMAALIRPTYVLLPFPMAIHMLLSWRNRIKAISCSVAIIAGLALIVGPWTYRNYKVTGGFVLISSNGGLNLYSANNDQADGAYTASASDFVYKNSTNDLDLQKLGKKLAVEWIRTHPGRFVQLAVIKFAKFWSCDQDISWWALDQPRIDNENFGLPRSLTKIGEDLSNGYYLSCIAGALGGLFFFRKKLRQDVAWGVLITAIAYFTLIHMVFESQAKYHFSLVPLFCIFTALCGSGLRSAAAD